MYGTLMIHVALYRVPTELLLEIAKHLKSRTLRGRYTHLHAFYKQIANGLVNLFIRSATRYSSPS
jgi:hypothetical protein